MVATSCHLMPHICVPNRFITHVETFGKYVRVSKQVPKLTANIKLTSFNFHPSQVNIAPIDTLEILFAGRFPR